MAQASTEISELICLNEIPGDSIVSNFVLKMQEVCQKIQSRMDKVIGNEQATKDSLIKPFFNALGVDTEDPDCWVPEYKADIVGKKNPEKVDYAVMQSNAAVVFIEAKPFNNSEKALISRDGQLARYFNATPTVKVSIITNGVVFRFFTDLARENVQDEEPFFVFDVRNHEKSDIEVLEMFCPTKFDVKTIRGWASENKSKIRIQRFLYSILTKPEENKDFVKFVVEQTFDGLNTASVRDTYSARLPDLMKEAVDLCISERLGLAQKAESKAESHSSIDQLATTAAELNAFATIKGIVSGSGRDGFSVLHKDYPKWFNISHKRAGNWFARLYFREDSNVLLLRLPYQRAITLCPGDDRLQERQAGVAVTLDGEFDIGSYTKLICEAFDICSSGKQQDSDSESVELEIEKSA